MEENLDLFDQATTIMGVLNVTPDSFHDGGRYNKVDLAIERAEEMVKEGADIIDIGGESTSPGSDPVSLEEELNRVIPILKSLNIDVPISIDTYKPKVANKSLKNGASIINDIYGLRYDKRMANVVAEHDCPVIIMHMQEKPETMQKNPTYKDPVKDIKKFFRKRINFAKSKEIDQDKIIIDPGIGFGKTKSDNLEIIRRLNEFKSLDKPILIGISRKSLINDLSKENLSTGNRLIGSISAEVISALKGAQIIRTHDVKETKKALEVVNSILEEESVKYFTA